MSTPPKMFSKPVYNDIKYPQPQYNQIIRLPSFNELMTSIPLPSEFLSRQTSPISYPKQPQYYYQPPQAASVSPKSLPTPPPSTSEDQKQEIKDITPKRKHVCKVCSRSFTTSGHLARHNRIHTGERRHVCPWPTCEARFARQDNCMQHYKTHTNGKSKRSKLSFKNINSKRVVG